MQLYLTLSSTPNYFSPLISQLELTSSPQKCRKVCGTGWEMRLDDFSQGLAFLIAVSHCLIIWLLCWWHERCLVAMDSVKVSAKGRCLAGLVFLESEDADRGISCPTWYQEAWYHFIIHHYYTGRQRTWGINGISHKISWVSLSVVILVELFSGDAMAAFPAWADNPRLTHPLLQS